MWRRLQKIQTSLSKKKKENGSPKVSFVIPVWNMAFEIPQTIESLLKQRLKEIEIIVVDDGSTDYLADIVAYYRDQDKRVRYMRFPERAGAARCRNAGNRQAGADIICVVDAGDIYSKHRAEIAYDYFRKHRKIDVLCCGCVYLGNEELDSVMPRVYKAKLGERLRFEHPAVAYRKKVAIKWPYREDSLDTDQYDAFFFTLGKNGIKFGVTGQIVTSKATRIYYKGGRDLDKARMRKLEIYREFGINIPEWLLKFEKNYNEAYGISHDQP